MGIIENTADLYRINSASLLEETNQGIANDYAAKMINFAPVRLKQIVPIVDDGNTERLLICKETDTTLFDCTFYIDGEEQSDDDRYLTAEQLHLFKELGKIQYDDQMYSVAEIVPLISRDELVMKCDIYLNLGK